MAARDGNRQVHVQGHAHIRASHQVACLIELQWRGMGCVMAACDGSRQAHVQSHAHQVTFLAGLQGQPKGYVMAVAHATAPQAAEGVGWQHMMACAHLPRCIYHSPRTCCSMAASRAFAASSAAPHAAAQHYALAQHWTSLHSCSCKCPSIRRPC